MIFFLPFLPVLCRNVVIALNSFLVRWQWVRFLADMFGKALFCECSSAVVLQLGTCPPASVQGMEPCLLFELSDPHQHRVNSYFLHLYYRGIYFSVLLLKWILNVLCCCVFLKSFNFRCDGSRTDFAFKRAFRNNFHAFFMHWSIEELLFRQVTDSLPYPCAEELCKMMSKLVFENVHNWIHISSSYSSMCGHLKHFIEKLKKSSKVIETEAESSRNLQTSVPQNSQCYWCRCSCPFGSISQHHLSKEVSGVMGDVCGRCVRWKGKCFVLWKEED